jgi:HNH endonuclease
MAHETQICVYCGNTNPADFAGREHVLPQSFGTFGSQTPTLHCVCDPCNSFFKKDLDQLLARDTLEGITRYKKGRFSREARVQKGLQISLSEGEETGDFGGVMLRGVDGTTGQLLPPIAQFHALNITTGRYDKFSKEQIRDLKLPEGVYGKSTERKFRVIAASQEEHNAVVEELRKAGIPYRERGRFSPPFLQNAKPGETIELEVTIEGTIDDAKKRSLVKIVFNFATYYLGPSETSKPEWDKARRFVRFGSETLKARVSDKPFWDGQETKSLRFEDDSYNLRIENLDGNVVGVIQLFNLFTYEFILAENYSLCPEQEIAYRFTPGQEPERGIRLTKLTR